MLVAEIGLPPGNDVDRSSLDRAVAGSGWTVCSSTCFRIGSSRTSAPVRGSDWFSFQFTTRYEIEGDGGAVDGVRLLQAGVERRPAAAAVHVGGAIGRPTSVSPCLRASVCEALVARASRTEARRARTDPVGRQVEPSISRSCILRPMRWSSWARRPSPCRRSRLW